MKKLFSMLGAYKKEFIIGPSLKLMEAIIELLLPTLMTLIIDNGILKNDTAYIYKIGGIMLALATVGVAGALCCQYFGSRTSQAFGTELKNKLFAHVSKFSCSNLDKFGTATLINRITADVNQLQTAVAMLIRLVIRAPFICIGAFIMALFLNAKLSLILLACIPILGFIIYLIAKTIAPKYSDLQKKSDSMGKVLRESLSGVRVIRAFTKEKSEQERFEAVNSSMNSTAVKAAKVSALLSPLTTFVVNIAILIILWQGGISINSGTFTQGEIIAFVNYVTQIMLSLIIVSNLIILYNKSWASAKRVAELLDTPEENRPEEYAGLSFSTSNAAIEFKNVSFSYEPGGEHDLEDINIIINQGQTVGVIGGTGSGKSTLASLIAGLYPVTSGKLSIFGNDINVIPAKQLNSLVGIVPQRSLLFTGTIEDNIRWGNKDASDSEVVLAAKASEAHHFISKRENGYKSEVARAGRNFSGGQRQRLCIARTLIKKPKILIFDDSCSALDYATDASVRKNVREYISDTTFIIISQRITTIQNSDMIIVMDDGKIAGFGTDEYLRKNCAIYSEILNSQSSSGESEEEQV